MCGREHAAVADYYSEIIDRRAQEERDLIELEDAEEEVALEQDEVRLAAAANLVVGAQPARALVQTCIPDTHVVARA